MRKLLCVLAALLTTTAFGWEKSLQELSDSLEAAIRTTATGQIEEGINQLLAQGIRAFSPKDRATKTAEFKPPLEQMRTAFGAPRRVTRISLVLIGEDYARIRILDRREDGGALWTFFCEKDSDKWAVFNWSLSGNDELGVVFKELDVSDYTKPAPETPSAKTE